MSELERTALATCPEPNGPSRSVAKARCAVAEYLRDLGLRDPDVIAKESQRIVVEATQQFAPAELGDEARLCEAAIRLTVKQLEHWLDMLSSQAGSPEEPGRLGSVIAARLPVLLDRFPQALNGEGLPPELVDSLQNGLTPVVPPQRPHGMRRQVLPLVPPSVRRLSNQLRNWMFRNAS